MALRHGVYDTDTHFVINPLTRTMRNEGSTKTMLIQHDHNSERFTFEIPRVVEGHDMTKCDVVQIHYNNIDSKSKLESKGIYKITDVMVSPEDPDVVIFSWLIPQVATKHVGTLNFLVRFLCVGKNSEIEYAWNTAIHSNITISNGMNNGEVVVGQYVDILEAWYLELMNAGNSGVNVVVGAQNEALEKISNAHTKAMSDIEGAKDSMFEEIGDALGVIINIQNILTGGDMPDDDNGNTGNEGEDTENEGEDNSYGNVIDAHMLNFTFDGETEDGDEEITLQINNGYDEDGEEITIGESASFLYNHNGAGAVTSTDIGFRAYTTHEKIKVIVDSISSSTRIVKMNDVQLTGLRSGDSFVVSGVENYNDEEETYYYDYFIDMGNVANENGVWFGTFRFEIVAE